MTQNLIVRLALGQAQINRIVLECGGRQYLVYPEGEQAIAYEGEGVTITLFIQNIGDNAIIFTQLSSLEVPIGNIWDYTNYMELSMLAGQETALDFIFFFTMPNTNVNVTIEAGHI